MPFSPDVAPLVSHMPAVDEYRESLLRLQGVWDSLSMLGQMSGTLPDIEATRSAFQSLTEKLLDSLGRCLLGNAVQHLRNRAQVAIDILVRNLFERTADIGFLATDTALCSYLQACMGPGPADATQRRRLEARFADYAAKYTVYDDVVLLAADGRVLARLDGTVDAPPCQEPWLAQALSGAPYVEHFGRSALMGSRTALLYAAGVRVGPQMQGVLCLSFRFDDEMGSVFRQLLAPDDAAVITLVNAGGEVLASSDRWQVPVGAALPALKPRAGARPDHQALRFAGRPYLSVSAAATGYEGYHGPGWSARAMVPVDQAFEPPAEGHTAQGELLASIDTRELFSAELQQIPQEARRIQRDLSRVLWNGKLQPAQAGASSAFTATLLREVGLTGDRIRQVFDQAIDKLHRATLAAVFEEARHHAQLAIDIRDRNLYERANDCRWWALDGVLRQTLAEPAAQRDVNAATQVLRRINGLYTVYALLVLFDTEGRVVAVSDPAAQAWQGRQLDAPWVRATLSLRDAQSHAASAHEPSALYGDRATCIFTAAVRAPTSDTQVVGGIAIVFDGEPQFEAMLQDSLPQGAAGSAAGSTAALFVTRSGRVVSSSDARWAVGSTAPTLPGWAQLPRGASGSTVIELEGIAYVAGYGMSGGYREYGQGGEPTPDDVAALVLMRLGPHEAKAAAEAVMFEAPNPAARHSGGPSATSSATQAVAIASFVCDGLWLGVPAMSALQALHRPRIAALPNAPAHLLGMTVFDGQLLPVVDVAQLRTGRASTDADAPVIVVRGRAGHRFALRVDELGPVFEAPQGELQALQQALGSQGGERLLRSGPHMLTLLDMDQLMQSSGVVKTMSRLSA